MDKMEQDIKVLDKLLNSPLILNDFPYIKKTLVYKYNKHIDIVFVLDEETSDYVRLYFVHADEIHSKVWDLAKMAQITSPFKIHP